MNRREKRRRLRAVLSTAYEQREKQAPAPDKAWRDRVMNNLPGTAQRAVREDAWSVMERLVWRLVPAAGVVALLLAVLVLQSAPEPTGDLASLYVNDVGDSSLYTFLQSETIQ